MALQPWIANPPEKFSGATTFTPPLGTREPIKLKSATPGKYATTTPTLSPGAGDLPPQRVTVGPDPVKPGQEHGTFSGKRTSSSKPPALGSVDNVPRHVTP
jgi:hypothetical protein